MTKALSLKLNNEVFQEVETILKKIKVPRNAYINRALEFYNRYNRKKLLKNQLTAESWLVRENSMEMLYSQIHIQNYAE